MQNYLLCCKSLKINKALCRSGYAALSRNVHQVKNDKSTLASKLPPPSDDPDWPKIYKLRWMPYIAAVNRLKIYTTTISVICIPAFFALYKNGSITYDDMQLIGGVATLACLTLTWFSYYCRRLIGHIHFNKDTQMVKISHLTFWARKKVIYVPVDDIVSLTDGSCKASDVYVKVYRCNSKDHLLMSLKFGEILEKEEFEYIFGNLDVLHDTKK